MPQGCDKENTAGQRATMTFRNKTGSTRYYYSTQKCAVHMASGRFPSNNFDPTAEIFDSSPNNTLDVLHAASALLSSGKWNYA